MSGEKRFLVVFYSSLTTPPPSIVLNYFMLPAVFEQIILLQPQTNRGSVPRGTISSVFFS